MKEGEKIHLSFPKNLISLLNRWGVYLISCECGFGYIGKTKMSYIGKTNLNEFEYPFISFAWKPLILKNCSFILFTLHCYHYILNFFNFNLRYILSLFYLISFLTFNSFSLPCLPLQFQLVYFIPTVLFLPFMMLHLLILCPDLSFVKAVAFHLTNIAGLKSIETGQLLLYFMTIIN